MLSLYGICLRFYESCSLLVHNFYQSAFLPSSSIALLSLDHSFSLFSISKSSVILLQLCVKKNQVHFIYYPYTMYGHINIWLDEYCSWHLSCCFSLHLGAFCSSSDYMIHEWVIIPGKEDRSQWQFISVYFRLVCRMWVLPKILCPVRLQDQIRLDTS